MANFCASIAESAEKFPSLPAIELAQAGGQTATTTYAGLMQQAGRLAGWLKRTAGLSTGDRAAILADNDARWIAAYLGTMWIGGVAVPLDTAYKPAQVRAILESSGARVLFTTPKYLETARAGAALLGSLAPRVVLLSGSAADLAGPADIDAVTTAPAMIDRATADAAVILYTSGTTADPKGVVLTHGNLDAERLAALSIVHCTERDAVLGVLPLFHALAQMANLLLPLSVGARVVFLETVSSTTLLSALETRGISIFACVPQFFYLIHQRVTTEVAKGGPVSRRVFRTLIATNVWLRDRLGLNPGRLVFAKVHKALGSAMRVLVTGGSRFDPDIGRDLYGMGLTIVNGYGLTETSGAATIQRPDDKFTTSVGQALPGVEVRIARTSNSRLQTSHFELQTSDLAEGEICISGPVVMREYFNRPDATAEALRDGWLHTGDLGRLDAQGRLYITGRLKEIIVLASGKNLYPEEIEAHYRQCVFIKELCVLGLARPGEPAAERLHAVIVPNDQALRDRGTVNVRDLLRFELETLSVQLPAHKRILSYDISLEPLPRTTTGKLKRPEIERHAIERAASRTRVDDRPLSSGEREWAAAPGHAEMLELVAGRLSRRAVHPDANLELDLGLDSMERVELLTALEQRAGTRVAPNVRATIFTVRQLVDAAESAERTRDEAAGDAALESGAPSDDAWDALLAMPPDPSLAANLRRDKTGRAIAFFVALRLVRIAARISLKFRASGLEHLPSKGPFIICPNHQAYIDPGFLFAVLPFRAARQFYAVGAAEYFATPLGAWIARAINIVPVDPDANLVTAMQAAATGLREGKVLVLFPEGEQSMVLQVKRFRRGAAILSAQMKAPIIPVALDGLYELWPRGRPFRWSGLLPWRSAPVTLRFGPPMQVTPGAYYDGTVALQRAVADLLGEIRKSA